MKVNRDISLRKKIKNRLKTQGTNEKPRLSVYRSNAHIYVQAIDDISGVTMAEASSLKVENGKLKKTDKSVQVGKELASKLKKLKIVTAVFDRGAYRYHGRVKALADSIREGGVNF